APYRSDFDTRDSRSICLAPRKNRLPFGERSGAVLLKGWGASGSSKSRVAGDDIPGTGLRAHLSRASTAGRQQSKSVARGEGPQLGGARDSAAPRFGNARLSIAVQIDGIRRTWTYVIRELTIIDATIEDRQIGASEMHQILPDHNSAGEMFSGPL